MTDPQPTLHQSTAQPSPAESPSLPTCYEDDISHVASSIYRCHRLKPYLKATSRVLELGCSTGKLVELVAQCGVAESVGIEISLPEARYGQQCHRHIKTTYLQDCQFPDDYFDVIQAHHVLEHIPNVIEVVQDIARILKVGGIFYITVPRYTSWFAQSPEWMGWFPQEHSWHFTEHSLTRLLSQYGFKRIRYSCPLTNNFLTRRDALYLVKRGLKAAISRLNLGDTVEAMFVKSQR